MVEPPSHCRAVCLVLIIAALRTFPWLDRESPADWLDPRTGPPTLLPDLAISGVTELSWLPGMGRGRAAAVVAGRPFLGVPLTPSRLVLMDGVGEETARQVAAFYRRSLRSPQGGPVGSPTGG
jgi:hypothetical protein